MKNKINTEILEKIVNIPSVSADHKACLKALRVIEKKLRKSKIPSFIGDEKGFHFLIAGEQKNAKVLFLSHIDVVPAKPEQFRLKRQDNKFLGRGVLDMKGPLTILLETFIKLWRAGNRNFLFVVTSDEEIGGFNGTCFLVKQFKKIRLAIIPDSTSGEKIVFCQKAPFHIKIFNNKGVSVHGSTPWKGINSCEKVANCSIDIVKTINKGNPKETSATITQIHSGSATNVVPSEAFSTIDIRIRSNNEVKPLIQTINFITRKHRCEWEKIDEPFFFEISKRNFFVKKWVFVFRKVTGKHPEFNIESGASDARFLCQAGFPAIITSAEGSGAHSENEWVSKKSLIQFGEILLKFCHSLRL